MDLEQLKSCLGVQVEDASLPDGQTSGSDVDTASVPAGAQTRAPEQQDDSRDRLAEVEMAARLGYLLCQCTWPPQIMVLARDGELFCCPRCQRRRDF